MNWTGWKSGWWVPTHKVAWFFDHVVLQDHVTNWKYFISTAPVPMATKHSRMVRFIPWEAPNQWVSQPWEAPKYFDPVIMQGQVANKNYYISATRVPMNIRLGRMITCFDGLLLSTRSCDKLKLFLVKYYSAYG